jgi:benzoate-CoA ligase family protein
VDGGVPVTTGYSRVDLTASPPRVELPREYNLAADLLDRHVIEGRGDRIAVIDADGRHSYRWLAERARRAASALAALGVEPEQRVALCMLDTVEMPAAFLGAIALGAVPVLLNTLLTTDDYRYLLRDCRARVVVASDALIGKLAPAVADAPALRAVAVATSPLGGAPGAYPRWGTLVDAALPLADHAATTPDDVAFWLYSSGSTGKPKGAMHVHASAIYTAALYARPVLGISADDVVYSAAKLFFAYGLGNSLTFPFSVGATAVLVAERPTPTAVLATFAAHRPTIFCGVPTLFAQLLADPALGRRDHLRLSTSAGEALPRLVGERWRERVGSDILDGIGSTELLHIFLSNTVDDIAYGTTGRPVPGYDLELRDDDGLSTDADEGALWVRGPTACIGYWNDRARSLATFHGPWTRTGDRYARDRDGRWTYSGRADDMLKVGGIWVSPFEVESALASHPAVLEAAVVGHPDTDGLIKPKAFVVLAARATATTEQLVAHVKAQLAPFKYPRWIDFVAELPKTATGKIQRFKLRSG